MPSVRGTAKVKLTMVSDKSWISSARLDSANSQRLYTFYCVR